LLASSTRIYLKHHHKLILLHHRYTFLKCEQSKGRSWPSRSYWKPSFAKKEKAKRHPAAILKYLTLAVEQILEFFSSGAVVSVGKVALRSKRRTVLLLNHFRNHNGIIDISK